MKHIELHILQSFPVTCLNRDDLGAPKSAWFGGVERARVSSQCWKRSVREFVHETMPELFNARRSKILGPAIEKAAKTEGADERTATAVKEIVLDAIGRDRKKPDMLDTMFFFSPESLKNVVRPLVTEGEKKLSTDIVNGLLSDDKKNVEKAKEDTKKFHKGILNAFGENVTDAADIAIFGRMVAGDKGELTVEGAASFSHPLSTHVVRNELDFFSAVDDEKNNTDGAGAGHIGSVEYNSACYYRCAMLNIDQIKKNNNLHDQTQLRTELETLIRGVILANPAARKNSMFGQVPPSYILAVKRSGQPYSLANAFEVPIRAKNGGGFVEPSIEALKNEWDWMKKTYNIIPDVECEIEKGKGVSLNDLIEKILADVC